MPYETYIRHANGNKAVLFIHGILGSPKHFEKFISYVPDDFGIYNILLDGHGGTVCEFSKTSMAIWKKQVDAAVRELINRYDGIYITAHSMGTFFAMNTALKYPEHIKGLILLQTPLKIGVKPVAVINTMKTLFGINPGDDDFMRQYKSAHSIKLNLRLWEYIGWIPRYSELFSESRKARKTIRQLALPCDIFQSENDELVSLKSIRFIPSVTNIKLNILKNSMHFIYSEEDYSNIIDGFCKMIK